MSLASDLAGPIAADACDRVAKTLVNGFEFCSDQGYGLNDLQKIALVSAALACMDGFGESAASGLTVGSQLRSSFEPLFQVDENTCLRCGKNLAPQQRWPRVDEKDGA